MLLFVAQTEWPKKQAVELAVPVTPGSATDIVGRIVAEKLGPALGTTVIVLQGRSRSRGGGEDTAGV